MAITYETMETLIPNTTMRKLLKDGVHITYNIEPNEGYVLHDKGRDMNDLDPETMETIFKLGYTGGMASCGANYQFYPEIIATENGEQVIGYGSREFFAKLK